MTTISAIVRRFKWVLLMLMFDRLVLPIASWRLIEQFKVEPIRNRQLGIGNELRIPETGRMTPKPERLFAPWTEEIY